MSVASRQSDVVAARAPSSLPPNHATESAAVSLEAAQAFKFVVTAGPTTELAEDRVRRAVVELDRLEGGEPKLAACSTVSLGSRDPKSQPQPELVDDAEPAPAFFKLKKSRRGEGVRPRASGMFSSLLVHGLLLLGVGMVALPTLRPTSDMWLESAPLVEEELAESLIEQSPMAENSLDAPISPVSLIEDASPGLLAVQSTPVAPGALGEGLGGTALEAGDGAASLAGGGGLGDVGALLGGGGAGGGKLAKLPDELGPEPLAKFFGAAIEGRRIVFVLDNSGSMQNGRLETVIAELNRCVASLTPKQEFYVIFYSDSVYPLYYPDPVARYIPSNKLSRKLLAEWLDSVELCLGDAVVEAVSAATMIEPDAVYLLSDGNITGDRKMQFLLAGDQRNFPIHTIAVGLGRAPAGRRNLQMIAEANGGQFRDAEVPAAMRDEARRNPRPYHHDAPGEIWGRMVKTPRSWSRAR